MTKRINYGQGLLKEFLGLILYETPMENYRPEWLFGMELDLFYPKSRLAFEFQGDQHFEAGIFGDRAELSKQQWRDARKLDICKSRRITVCAVIASELSINVLIGKISGRRKLWRNLVSRKLIKDLSFVKEAASPLRNESIKYRAVLRQNYDSATACYKHKRNEAMLRNIV